VAVPVRRPDDAALVHRLAIEKLEAKAEELRPQWAWTKAVLDPEYRMLAQYARVEPKPAKVPADLAAEIERIEQRLGELPEIDGDDFTDELAAEAAQLEERRTEIDEILDGLAVFSKKDRKRTGCIVTIGESGEFCLHQGLVDPSSIRSTADADEFDALNGDDDDEPFTPAGDDEDDNPGSRPSSAGAEQALRKECGFSQQLVDDLKAHRLQITRAHLAADFEVAFDLALYSLCVDLFDQRYRSHPLDLRANEAAPRSSLNDLSGTPADQLIEVNGAKIDLDWLKLPPAEGFVALSALPTDAKQRLFAWCIASTLKPQLAIEDPADPVIEAAGRRLAIPFADFWRPTAANYWGRAKKAHGLDIGRGILGDRWARDHADDKKPVLAAALETAFDPAKSTSCIGFGQSVRDNAAAWLPPGMAYGKKEADPQHDDADRIGLAAPDSEPGDAGIASADLPAFLTDDRPEGIALNGAAA
jgi:ParB family transcriptional regulator, chromosome partitioning protein